MLLKNFLLSRAKAELSPRIKHLSKTPGTINQAIKKVTTYIDDIVLEHEGVATKDHLTKRKYEALETVLSYLVQEGYSQVKQDHISKKSGISKPVINYIFNWLQDLGVCQQIKVRRHGKIAPSIYILTLHNNYLKIVEYFRVKWAFTIDVCSTFTDQLKKKIFKKNNKLSHEDKPVQDASNGLDVFNLEESANPAVNNEPKNRDDRLHDLSDYLSEDQQRAYNYIMLQKVTNLSEKDAYVIANRMPPDIGESTWYYFEQCVKWFKFNKADKSNPAHFIKMFGQQYKAYLVRRGREESEAISNLDKKRESTFIFYDFLKGN
ncbi:Replicase RepFR55 [Bacillus sp. AFS018417]|uniref:Replicase RepFR55 n=1 Tax=Bacillus sp. AFS018417 TaxID=2033491 RepID=UPI000BF81550|nr:Replicase RepFR55 [Bacillus sp. AFS018417]PEZ05298.1 Replicase RepFR55 [Bacillus sp. AFS018417]